MMAEGAAVAGDHPEGEVEAAEAVEVAEVVEEHHQAEAGVYHYP